MANLIAPTQKHSHVNRNAAIFLSLIAGANREIGDFDSFDLAHRVLSKTRVCKPPPTYPFAAFTASVSAGTTSNRSPTIP